MSTVNESGQTRKIPIGQSSLEETTSTTHQPDTASTRILDLELVRSYINAIDFTMMKAKMNNKEDGLGWSTNKIAYVERQYKNWLYLRRKFENKDLPPSIDIDVFWHYHILDTRAYHRDVAMIFGYYLHHFPYFGMRGEDDHQNAQDAFEKTQQLYLAEFGEEIYEFEDE